jgi:glycosyltransferase involved in cell wall biosynthesis
MGGGEEVMLSLIDGFKKQGWHVKLVLCSKTKVPSYAQIAQFFGSSIFPDDALLLKHPKQSRIFLGTYFHYKSVARWLKDCDVVIQLFGNPRLSYLTRARYFYYKQFPTSNWPGLVAKVSRLSAKLIWTLLTRSLSESARGVNVVHVSKFLRDDDEVFRTALWTSVDIPPPVDADRFNKLRQTEKMPFKIVSIGRFAREKNHFQQLEVMSLLLKHRSDWQLIMIGSTKMAESKHLVDSLRRKIISDKLEANVSFLENGNMHQLESELSTAQYFLHTNHKEAFGISVLEAIAAGCVPVVPSEGGVSEIVSNELLFSSSSEAVDILEHLSTGWRPSSVLSCEQDYSERAFQQRWIELVQGESQDGRPNPSS